MMKAQIGPLGLAFAIAFFFPAVPALAAVVNVDFEQPGDATYAGGNGILSSAGTTWNCVLFDTDATGLADESASTTGIELIYTRNGTPPGPFVNLGVFNDLQDTGVLCEGFEIRNLVPDSEYTLAVYGAMGTSFSVEHANGYSGGPCTGFGPGFSLPGAEGQDYCLLTGLVPTELSPGVFGLRVVNASGPILGLQLEGSTVVVEPPDDPEDPVQISCSDLVTFFDEAVAAGTLDGDGPGNSAMGRRGAMRHMLIKTCELFEAGQVDKACEQLRAAQKKCNGGDRDFVRGEAASELADLMAELSLHLCLDDDQTSESPTRKVSDPLSDPPATISWGLIKTIYNE